MEAQTTGMCEHDCSDSSYSATARQSHGPLPRLGYVGGMCHSDTSRLAFCSLYKRLKLVILSVVKHGKAVSCNILTQVPQLYAPPGMHLLNECLYCLSASGNAWRNTSHTCSSAPPWSIKKCHMPHDGTSQLFVGVERAGLGWYLHL